MSYCPCKDCESRNSNCHSNCKDYIDWDNQNKKRRSIQNLENQDRHYWLDTMARTNEKYWRKHK